MSIKIIKPGVRLTDPIRFTCERCGCEFEADKKSYHRKKKSPRGQSICMKIFYQAHWI